MLNALLFRVRQPTYLALGEAAWTRERITASGSIAIEVRWRSEGHGVVPVDAVLLCWRKGRLVRIPVSPRCIISPEACFGIHSLVE